MVGADVLQMVQRGKVEIMYVKLVDEVGGATKMVDGMIIVVEV